jgi:single-stranded-DNA-specific exonuclease
MNDEFKAAIKKAAEEFKKIDKKETIKIITHLDADGISAASIIIKSLHNRNMRYAVSVIPQLDKEIVKNLANENYSTMIFTDLGSGNIEDMENNLADRKIFVLDHHRPKKEGCNKHIIHVNPHLSKIDGSKEISAAGVAYLFSKEIYDGADRSAYLALIGSTGDVQEKKGFIGLNKEILEDAIDSGKVKTKKGMKLFGYSGKMLHKALEYCSEPHFKGITGNEKGAILFLESLGIYDNGKPKSIRELDETEINKIIDALIEKTEKDIKPENLMGYYYILIDEEEESLKEVREFSTVLNACGRMGKPSLGIGCCLGDRDMQSKAIHCLDNYRKELTSALEWFKANRKNRNIIEGNGFIIINAKDKIRSTIIGTISSMLSKSDQVEKGCFVVSMARTIDNNTKASLRVSGEKKDIDLRDIAKDIITKLNSGEYGGHRYAAGALFPSTKEDEFIDIAKDVLEKKSLEEGIY